MTGRYPSAIHVNYNGNDFFPKAAEATLVSRLLAEAGYDCGLVGKLHLAGCAVRREPRADDGFRYFQWSHSPRPNWKPGEHDYADWLRAQGGEPAEVLRLRHERKDRILEPAPDDDNVPVALHHLTWNRLKALEFLDQAREPWLLCVNTFEPHPPFNPPWEYYRRFDPAAMPGAHFRESDLRQQNRLEEAGVFFQTTAQSPAEIDDRRLQAAYYAMIEMVDHQLGALLEHLRLRGQLENTIVVFMSDHGDMLGDHGLVLKGCRFYEALVRVPLIWWRPGRFEQGVRNDALVELTDVAPTLLELAGLPVPQLMQGRSLLPLLSGGRGRHRDFVRCEYFNSSGSEGSTRATMYLEGSWKLITYHDASTGELYDLAADPWEHHDLWDAAKARGRKEELVRRSFDATVLSGDPGPPRTMNH
jgi:arylsulfatase A-like enzyme